MPTTADNTIGRRTSGSRERKPRTDASRINFYPVEDVEAFVAALGRLDQCNGRCQVCTNPCSAQAGVLEAQANGR